MFAPLRARPCRAWSTCPHEVLARAPIRAATSRRLDGRRRRDARGAQCDRRLAPTTCCGSCRVVAAGAGRETPAQRAAPSMRSRRACAHGAVGSPIARSRRETRTPRTVAPRRGVSRASNASVAPRSRRVPRRLLPKPRVALAPRGRGARLRGDAERVRRAGREARGALRRVRVRVHVRLRRLPEPSRRPRRGPRVVRGRAGRGHVSAEERARCRWWRRSRQAEWRPRERSQPCSWFHRASRRSPSRTRCSPSAARSRRASGSSTAAVRRRLAIALNALRRRTRDGGDPGDRLADCRLAIKVADGFADAPWRAAARSRKWARTSSTGQGKRPSTSSASSTRTAQPRRLRTPKSLLLAQVERRRPDRARLPRGAVRRAGVRCEARALDRAPRRRCRARWRTWHMARRSRTRAQRPATHFEARATSALDARHRVRRGRRSICFEMAEPSDVTANASKCASRSSGSCDETMCAFGRWWYLRPTRIAVVSTLRISFSAPSMHSLS